MWNSADFLDLYHKKWCKVMCSDFKIPKKKKRTRIEGENVRQNLKSMAI